MSRPFPAVTTGKPTILKRQAFINTDRRRSKIQTGDMEAPLAGPPVFDVPASPSHTSSRPILDVLKSLVSRPKSQVPSPHTRVLLSPSPCPRSTFIASHHYSQFALSHSPRENTHLKKRKIREYPRFAQDAFNREFLQIDWETSNSVDESFAQFYNKLNKLINFETTS